jgi:uncharacterized protein YjiS (DUF1127 family)
MHSQKYASNPALGSVVAPAGQRFGAAPDMDVRFQVERQAQRERAVAISRWVGGGIAKLVAALRTARRRRIAMAELASLDDRMLADIGISRSEIRAAVSGASGLLPRALGPSAAAPSLNDDAMRHAA